MFCLLHAGIGSEEETVHDSTPDSLESGVRFGVYEIDCHADGNLCELGRGSMGVTYRATDTSLRRKVALKIIKTDIAERSADARERFVREARAAAALRHEHIATVYQFGMRLETGQYFYAMELIEGETLDERVRRAGPLDARSTIGIAQQVTSALAAAEKHGLVHRDLKPANLMLVNADDPEVMGSDQARSKRSRIRALRKSGIPVVKIIDFGLAKAWVLVQLANKMRTPKTGIFLRPIRVETNDLVATAGNTFFITASVNVVFAIPIRVRSRGPT